MSWDDVLAEREAKIFAHQLPLGAAFGGLAGYRRTKSEKTAAFLVPAALGFVGARKGQRMLRAEGMSEDAADVDGPTAAVGGIARALGYAGGGALAAYLAGRGRDYIKKRPFDIERHKLPIMLSLIGGELYGAHRSYRAPIERAERAIKAHRKEHQKVAGLFMRPSDIAEHTDLARELEARLNGTSSAAKFKRQPGGVEKTASRHVDAGVGAAAGLVADLLSRRRAHALVESYKAKDIETLNRPENIDRLNDELERVARSKYGKSLADLHGKEFEHALDAAKKKILRASPHEGGRIRAAIARVNRAAVETRVQHPVASGAASAGTGALVGYYGGPNMKRHYAAFMRAQP